MGNRKHKFVLSLTLFLALAGCGWFGDDLPPVQRMPNPDLAQSPSSQPPQAGAEPALPAGEKPDSIPTYADAQASIVSDLITVTVSDPLPVRSARLVAPDGRVTESSAIDTERHMAHNDYSLRPRFGVGVAGGSSSGVSTGFGIGFPLFSSGDTRTYSVTESRISFRLPDVAAYRRDWQRYAIAIDLDDGVNKRSFQMLPPAPPSP